MNPINRLINYGRKLFNDKEKPIRKAQAYGSIATNGLDFSNFKIGSDTFFSVYKNNGDVYSVIREYEQNVFANGFEWVNAEDPEKDPDEAFVQRAKDVYNYEMSFDELKKRMLRDRMLTGNMYLNLLLNQNESQFFGERVLGFQVVDPRTMAIVADSHGEVLSYKQRPRMAHDFVDFTKEEIAHWKLGADPDHEIFGMSPLEPILWEARTDLQAMVNNYSLFANGAMPAAWFILNSELGDEERQAAMDAINDQFRGAKNSHKSGVLSGVEDIKTLNISNRDLEFLAGRKFTTEKICSAYGVPKVMLNYTEGVNHSNSDTQRAKFIENTIIPTNKELADFFNRQVNTRITLNGISLSEKIKMVPRPQSIDGQGEIERRALLELDAGIITRRQYKIKTGQEVMPEDEAEPMFDKHIIRGGISSVLLEDVGVDPFLDPNDPEQNQKLLEGLRQLKEQKND